jgi:predicted esterase
MNTRRLLSSLSFLAAAYVGNDFAAAADHEFRFKKADAQSVAVLGEFNGWKGQAMTRGSDGTWTAKVSLPAGTHGYKFLVNGTDWTFDPENPNRKTVDGVENSAVKVIEGSSASPTRVASIAATPIPSAAASANKTPPAIAGALKPGEVTILDLPLSATQRAEAAKGGNPAVMSAKVAIGLPQDFDPQRSWPILVISATVEASSIELLGAYKQAALEEGWIVLAADGLEKPKEDNNDWRVAMISAGLDHMATQWPASKTWPIACAGFSGGGKRSGFIAGALAKEQRRIIGMLMGGVNQDMASEALHRYRPPAAAFRNVPIFLSSGTKDTIATPQQHNYVEGSMKGSGFRQVRLESFPGAHDVYPVHTSEALKWFASESAGPSATPRPTSSLDTFFKKP